MTELGCIAIGMLASVLLAVLAFRSVLRSETAGRSFVAGLIRGFAGSLFSVYGARSVVVPHAEGARVVPLEAIATAIERGDFDR